LHAFSLLGGFESVCDIASELLFIYETKPVFIKAFIGFLGIQKAFAPGLFLAL
jgi:hypothetical protein